MAVESVEPVVHVDKAQIGGQGRGDRFQCLVERFEPAGLVKNGNNDVELGHRSRP